MNSTVMTISAFTQTKNTFSTIGKSVVGRFAQIREIEQQSSRNPGLIHFVLAQDGLIVIVQGQDVGANPVGDAQRSLRAILVLIGSAQLWASPHPVFPGTKSWLYFARE